MANRRDLMRVFCDFKFGLDGPNYQSSPTNAGADKSRAKQPTHMKGHDMNRFIAITAVAIATVAGAANAMTQDNAAAVRAINSYAPSVDVSTLDDATILAALQAIHGSGTESEKSSTVRAILLNAN